MLTVAILIRRTRISLEETTVLLFDLEDFLVHNITHNLEKIKYQFLIGTSQGHHYVNYHEDRGNHLEIHEGLKNFRRLITNQIYQLQRSGVKLLFFDGGVTL